jgi:hypothetical protein
MLLIYLKCVEYRNLNLIFWENKKNQERFCKKTKINSEQIGEESFRNNIVSLFKL